MTTTERACARGCARRGQHYAACPAYGRDLDETCAGCVIATARDGAMVCHRCYGHLRRRIERAPALLAHVRERQHSPVVKRYDVERRGNRVHGFAPVAPDMLDALRDVSELFNAKIPADAGPEQVRTIMHAAVGSMLAAYDDIANDADAFLHWWAVVMPVTITEHPDFWTLTRTLARWPLEDRRRWAKLPCPDCDLATVAITPPAYAGAPTWYTCTSCDFEVNDNDPTGFPWDDVFGHYDTTLAPLTAED